METVGVRELKARLSDYLRRAHRGRRIIVTDRGRQVAAIVPVGPEQNALDDLIAAGKVKWSGKKPAGLKGVRVKGKDVASAVVEDRR
jgi:prevent-host-death family protein